MRFINFMIILGVVYSANAGEILVQKYMNIGGNSYARLTRDVTQNEINRQTFAAQGASVWARYKKFDLNGNLVRSFGVRITTDPFWNRLIYSDYGNWIKSYGDNPGDEQFSAPHGICRAAYVEEVSSLEYRIPIYIADSGNNRVVEIKLYVDYLSRKKTNGGIIFTREFSKNRNISGFNYPYDLAYDDNGTPSQEDDDYLWIVETGNHRVVKFNLQSGTIENEIGGYGSSEGEFRYPQYIGIEKSYFKGANDSLYVWCANRIFVVDNGNHRIVQLKDSSGTLLWKRTLNYSDSSWTISGISSDCFGNLWACDKGNSRILRFNKRLKYIGSYGYQNLGQGTSWLYFPLGVDNLFTTVSQGGYTDNIAADALFATETWSDGSGQIRYKVHPAMTKFRYYNTYISGDGETIYVKEPNNSPNDKSKNDPGDPPVYYGTTFYFTVSDNCKMRAYINHNNGTLIRSFDEKYVTAGERYLFWDGTKDDHTPFFYPGQVLYIGFRFESLYDPSEIVGATRNFKQEKFSGGDKEMLKTGEESANTIKEFSVSPNYPNPFNSTTQIKYQIPQAGKVELVIYNILGQKVKTLVNATQKTGQYTAAWNGRNEYGNEVGSGVYFYRIHYKGVNDIKSIKKILLLK